MGRQVRTAPFATTWEGSKGRAQVPIGQFGPPAPDPKRVLLQRERQVSASAARLPPHEGGALGAEPLRHAQWLGAGAPLRLLPAPCVLGSFRRSFLPSCFASRFAIWARASVPPAPPEDPGNRPSDGRGPGAGEVTAEEAGGAGRAGLARRGKRVVEGHAARTGPSHRGRAWQHNRISGR